jgi:hypothetical protein
MKKSNWSVAVIEERIEYTKKCLVEWPEINVFKKDEIRFAEMMEEALSRNYVGVDNKGNKAYVMDGYLYVEDMPSGWEYKNFSFGKTHKVCYDGGTNWFGTITLF